MRHTLSQFWSADPVPRLYLFIYAHLQMLNEVIPTGLPGSNSYESPNGTILLPIYNANQTIVSSSKANAWEPRFNWCSSV